MPTAEVFGNDGAQPQAIAALPMYGGGWALPVVLLAKTEENAYIPIALNDNGTIQTSPTAWGFVGSTNALLAAGATYISPAIMGVDWTRIAGICGASHAGTLIVEQSIDGFFTAGRTFRETLTYPDTDAGIAVSTMFAYSVERVSRFARVLFTNGGTLQTWFLLDVNYATIVR